MKCQFTQAAGMIVCHTCGWDDWSSEPQQCLINKTSNEASQVSKTKPVTERIKSFEDACRELGIEKLQLGVTV